MKDEKMKTTFYVAERFLYPLAFSLFLIFILYPSSFILFADVKVTAEIEETRAFANQPLAGTITVTHDEKEVVDTKSFQLDNKEIPVDFVKSVKLSEYSPLQLSIYQFVAPSKPNGLYVLPEVSVKVGSKVYKSIRSTYEVKKAGAEVRKTDVQTKGSNSTHATTTGTLEPSEAALELKAVVEGPKPLYPGQRFRLVYRFYFKGNIDLTKEELPLLDATGFQKIGDKETRDYHEGDWSVQEISQTVRAKSAGEYKFPASVLEGVAYRENKLLKKRTYLQPKLHAEVPATTVTVVSFPIEGKPAFFSGAVGAFTFEASLLTTSQVYLEEKMLLALDIFSRDADLQDVVIPSLDQPGIKGLFRLSDLPATGEVKNNTKRFVVELYPLSTSIKEIPSINFSFFDPIAEEYVTLHSQPIPITVSERQREFVKPKEEVKVPPTSKPEEQHVQPMPLPLQPTKQMPAPVSSIEIEGNLELTASDLRNVLFGTWSVLWTIPIGALLIALQIGLQRYLALQQDQKKPRQSDVVWQSAMKMSSSSSQIVPLISKALMLRLEENGEIASADIASDQLPQEGIAGQVRTFLMNVEESRFTGKEMMTPEQVMDEAKKLMLQLNERS